MTDILPDPRYPTIAHLEAAAARRVPRFGFDYLQGATGEERGTARNRQGFEDVRLVPRYMRDVTEIDLGCDLLGEHHALPIGVAPVGLGSIMWPDAAAILAQAAKRADIPFVLSTMATDSIERIAPMAGDKTWFQLYLTKDPEVDQALLERAEKAGIRNVMVTVDIPAGLRRPRDIINGLTVPARMTPRNVVEIMRHPTWALANLGAGMPRFKNIEPYLPKNVSMMELARLAGEKVMCAPSADRIKLVRDRWKGKLMIKGIQHAEDAKLALDLGMDGIIVSNHGGRQLESAPSTMESLPGVVAAVDGRVPVMIDSGARSGEDVVKALVLGADMVFMGRPFYFALGAMGSKGGDHIMALLREEYRLALGQIGCTATKQLDRSWLAS